MISSQLFDVVNLFFYQKYAYIRFYIKEKHQSCLSSECQEGRSIKDVQQIFLRIMLDYVHDFMS